MRRLRFRIGLSNLGTRLAKPEAHLPEQALAPSLSHSVPQSRPPGSCRPQSPAQSHLAGHTAKGTIDLSELLLIQASESRPARSASCNPAKLFASKPRTQ
jgi:hypothetical protein